MWIRVGVINIVDIVYTHTYAQVTRSVMPRRIYLGDYVHGQGCPLVWISQPRVLGMLRILRARVRAFQGTGVPGVVVSGC